MLIPIQFYIKISVETVMKRVTRSAFHNQGKPDVVAVQKEKKGKD